MISPEQVKAEVSQSYAEKLERAQDCCAGSCCSDETLYPVEVLQQMPEGVVSFGYGNPTAIGSLQPEEAILDLGSGAGLDCFLAAQQEGLEGSVIGVDFTPCMIERPRRTPKSSG